MPEPIVIYTSKFCLHSRIVQNFFKERSFAVEFINIDGNLEARERVMALNRGYASVPTLLFPDGTQLTEPSMRELKTKLGIDDPGVVDRLKGFLGK